MKQSHHVGVDVGAKELVVAIDRDGVRETGIVFPNDRDGHRKLIRWATKKGASARVVLESTGVYGLDLAFALDRAKRVEVMVANPRAIASFAKASLRRSKTDALDAETILEFSIRMPFVAWVAPDPAIMELRALSRRIEAMSKSVTQEKNRLHASNQSVELSGFVRQDIRELVLLIEDRIERLRKQALRVIEEHSDLARAFGHLTSINGIANAAGIQLLAELGTLPPDMTVRQWVAHAGLDPRQHQSGTSIRKPARISKTGNAHLCRALFLPAMVALRWEPNVKAFYEKLLDHGKTRRCRHWSP
ncbi:MAG: IS110 family transposase [bacterium]|nr:IS110 family transposase [bacterium]